MFLTGPGRPRPGPRVDPVRSLGPLTGSPAMIGNQNAGPSVWSLLQDSGERYRRALVRTRMPHPAQ